MRFYGSKFPIRGFGLGAEVADAFGVSAASRVHCVTLLMQLNLSA